MTMTEPSDKNPPASPYHLKLDMGSGGDAALDWEAALKELEAAPPPRPKQPPVQGVAEATPPAATPSPARPTELSLYDQIRKKAAAPKPTITADDLRTLDELAEILASVNGALTLLDGFEKHHPESVPERTRAGWRHNLKETSAIMLREFHTLRHGKRNKTYDPRCVCTMCHTVALYPLPEGLCDECRGKQNRPGGAY